MARYKLTDTELNRLQYRGVITPYDVSVLTIVSKLREPNKEARTKVQITLNSARTIFLNSIKFYGGENFGKPYHFIGEITHKTTKAAFTRFMNENGIPRHAFKK